MSTTEEAREIQSQLRSALREMLDQLVGPAERHNPQATPRAVWDGFCSAGWLEVPLGMGEDAPLSWRSAVLSVVEELGRVLAPVALESVVASLLPRLALTTHGATTDEAIASILTAEERPAHSVRGPFDSSDGVEAPQLIADGDDWLLSGRFENLQTAPDATHAYVDARDVEGRPVLVRIELDRSGLDLEEQHTVDLTLQVAVLTADRVRITVADIIGDGCEQCAAAARTAAETYSLALDAHAIGAASAAVETTIRYVSEREQFGTVIGTFQALQHHLANAYSEVELSRALLESAAVDAEAGSDPRELEAAVATSRLFASGMFIEVAEIAIQCHGGYGFTWEQGIHNYYRRAIFGRQLAGGSTRRQRELLADSL